VRRVRMSLVRCRMALTVIALATSACQTLDDLPSTTSSTLPSTTSNIPASPVRQDDGKRTVTGGIPLTEAPVEKPSFFFGSGQFVATHSNPQGANWDDEPVTLNLVSVPVPQAAKTILSDILAVKYTIDPAVDGKITIQTPRPVPKSTIVDLFQSALQSNGAAIVNLGDVYRIVRADQAAVGASLRTPGASEREQQLGSQVQIVQLKYVAAAEMRRILEPMAPHGAIVRIDETRNNMTLSGNSQDIATMLDTISVFDVDFMKGMSFALVPVKTSAPDVIADQLKTVFSSDREGPMAGMVKFLPNRQLSSILVVSAQPAYLRRAADWVRRLDARAEGSEKQFFTYTVQNRPAQELVDVLDSMFSSETGGARGSTSRNVAPPYRESSLQSNGGLQSGGGLSSSGGLQSSSGLSSSGGLQSSPFQSFGTATSSPQTSGNYAQPTSLGNRPQQTYLQLGSPGQTSGDPTQEPRIKIAIDEGKNAILIQATPADYRRVMRVLRNLDVLPNQVLIEATIAEVTLNDELKFGVRWFFQGKQSNYTFTDDAGGALSSVFPGFSYALTAANVTATLNALNAITTVNVISSPSLTVMDNKTAVLQVGDEVPITTQSAVSVLTTGAPIVNSITYKDTGVILSITPRINESGRVLLDLEQEVSTVENTTSSGIDSPTISERRVRTSVVVNSGEPLALGGMIQTSKSVTRNQIPLLGDVPVIGNAFSQKDNTIAKTELIIIITPHIMRNLSEARKITDEFRRELAVYVTPPSRNAPSFQQNIRRAFE
jgi:general secretion pathway protein D